MSQNYRFNTYGIKCDEDCSNLIEVDLSLLHFIKPPSNDQIITPCFSAKKRKLLFDRYYTFSQRFHRYKHHKNIS